MRLVVPFIATRQLGAVGSLFGRQFLPSVHWRTGQSGAPPDMNSARFLSLFGEANRWTLGPLGTPDTVRCTLDTVRCTLDSPVRPSDCCLCHASPVDCTSIALPTVGADVVGSPDSPVNFSHGVLADSREQRVRRWASLDIGHCPVHTGQSGAPQAGTSLAGLSQTSPIQSHLIWQGS
jgi:hypothetical protein